ncbi:MAG TPA: hypothetical protein VF746_18350 [Longimicrobium sp.]
MRKSPLKKLSLYNSTINGRRRVRAWWHCGSSLPPPLTRPRLLGFRFSLEQ